MFAFKVINKAQPLAIHHSASGLSQERRKETDWGFCGSAAQYLTEMTPLPSPLLQSFH